MRHVKEAIVVEGKYDAQRVRAAVSGTVVETGGFRVFKDSEKVNMLRQLAAARGLIILTDSDSAGMVIRNHLLGCIPGEQIKNAYIPPIPGKERRKATPSAEGLLGVEGMDADTVVAALQRAGATFEDGGEKAGSLMLTKSDLVEAGLSGGTDSAVRRRRLLTLLGLPTYLSANRLLEVLNTTLTPDRWRQLLNTLDDNTAGGRESR